jgi:hypothetical protein
MRKQSLLLRDWSIWPVVRSRRLLGWVERNNTGSKMAQFACLSETQPPQRLLLVGFPSVNPTYNSCCSRSGLFQCARHGPRVRSLRSVLLLHR